ncbi:hypothetical protein [Oryzobacter telluris]|uniref:hypothetical protein n=1 Tax=Oryzobacter telluris TaxID=3149179 RepID=UPI00370D8DA7
MPPGYPPPAPGYAPPTGGFAPPPPGSMPGGAPYVAGLEFRPGIVPLRPLTLGDIFGGVTKAIRGNVAATIGLAVVTSLVCLVPTTALGAWLGSLETGSLESTEFGVGVFAQYVPAIGSTLSSIALTGFLAYVIGQAVLGRKVSIGETWDGTRRRLPALIGVVLLVVLGSVLILGVLIGPGVALFVQAGDFDGIAFLVTAVGTLAAVVLYVFLWVRLGFATALIVLEGRGVIASLRRSWELTRSGFWRLFGIRLLTSVVVGFAAQIITLPIALGGVVAVIAAGAEDQIFMWQAILTGVASLIAGALTTPFTAGVDALLTVDARIRREGLDVQLIHASQHGGPAPWPSAARTS